MIIKRATSYLLIGLMLGILTFVFGCANFTDTFSTKNPTEKFPIRTLTIQIEDSQHEELLSQMREFSEKNKLEFFLSFYNSKERFYIEMYGQGLEIHTLSKLVVGADLEFNFYEEDPANPPDKENVDKLYSNLKVFISKIPNVNIMEDE